MGKSSLSWSPNLWVQSGWCRYLILWVRRLDLRDRLGRKAGDLSSLNRLEEVSSQYELVSLSHHLATGSLSLNTPRSFGWNCRAVCPV